MFRHQPLQAAISFRSSRYVEVVSRVFLVEVAEQIGACGNVTKRCFCPCGNSYQ